MEQIFKRQIHFDNSTAWGRGLPRWHKDKESTCQCRRCKRLGLNPWVWKSCLQQSMQHAQQAGLLSQAPSSRPPEPRRGITAGHRARLLSSMCWCCSHSSLPLPIPRSVEVMKSPSNILINKVNEQTVSCREIGRGYFLSQKGRHISFWIYGLTWPNHAHLSLELRVDCCTKQLLLILERWKKKSI